MSAYYMLFDFMPQNGRWCEVKLRGCWSYVSFFYNKDGEEMEVGAP
jgi:hypothetical protein